MTSLFRDFRYAWRQLYTTPAFAITTILTLALTIGVATAAFSVVYAVLLRPLPYHQQERLVICLDSDQPRARVASASYNEYLDWRKGNQSFQSLAAVSGRDTNFETSTGTVPLAEVVASDNFFDVFEVKPLLGRGFLPGEERQKSDVVVLSYGVWQEQLGGRFDVIGQTAKVGGRPHAIVGVMPAGFRFPIGTRSAVYTPLQVAPDIADTDHWLTMVARLKPGISMQQAQADLNRMMAGMVQLHRLPANWRISLRSLPSYFMPHGLLPQFRLLVLAVLAVLGIGCVNVAGLLLAKGVRREHEFALRAAVGARRSCIARQLLVETLVLSLSGAAAGLPLACALLAVTRSMLVHVLARGIDVRLDLAPLFAAFGFALMSCVLAGMVPALRLSSIAPNMALRAGAGTSSPRGHRRLRASFVVVQVAVAFALLVAASVMLRELARLRSTDPGFRTDHLISVEVRVSPDAYAGRDIVANVYGPLVDKVKAIPGVREAGLVKLLPIAEGGWSRDIKVVGHEDRPSQRADVRWVTPGYFNALGIPLLRGRMLDPRLDTQDANSLSIVVNQAFVRKFLPEGEDPIGKRLSDRSVIVGVVGSIRQNLKAQALPEMDHLLAEPNTAEYRAAVLSKMQLVARTTVEPGTILPSLRRAFREVDPGLPFATPKTMPEVLDDVLRLERLQNWIFGTFAVLSIMLAMIGLYGLISQDIQLSTRDIGVRLALGASPRKVIAGVYQRVVLLLAGGLVFGLAITLGFRRVLSAVVVINLDKDPVLILGLGTGMLVTGLLAAVLPARRAAEIDPNVALRCE